MGCVASSIDKEEVVRACKERKKILKQLLVFRKQFADSQLAYLRALRNTGVTLRQFTESESLELEDGALGSHALSPSPPPPPLPPSPPPPPNFSPDLRNPTKKHHLKPSEEEIINIDEDGPPPPVLSSSWDYWDPFGSSSPQCEQIGKIQEQVEEEKWEEAKSEFEEELVDAVAARDTIDPLLPVKKQTNEIVDDNSSTMSGHTKDTGDMSMVIWRSKKTLTGIICDLDDYFVKASACAKDVAVFLDINNAETTVHHSTQENKRKGSNASKVFSAFISGWSSKSLQSARDGEDASHSSEPCKPGAHCVTLSRLYDAEQKLYKEVKDEALTKLEHQKKSVMLQKLQQEGQEWTKTDKTRSVVESLQSDIFSLQQSINATRSTMLKLVDDELHPQLIALTSGLMCMWQKMYECHQVQNHIAQQLNHLVNHQKMEPTTEYHRYAAAQLKSEVASWYSSFCKLMKSQKEYVSALCRWIQPTNSLIVNGKDSLSSSVVHQLSQQWLFALDKLPDKMALEAIKSLLSAVQSIVSQQEEEVNLYKRSDKLERRLQRELNSLAEMEMKFRGSFSDEEAQTALGPKHPITIRRSKIEVLKKHAEDEKSKYLNSVRMTRAMILNNLQASLPNVFRALMAFSNAYSQSFETVLSHGKRAEH